jgi:hypothetical protein
MVSLAHWLADERLKVTVQLTPDLPDIGVNSVTEGNARGAHLQM